MGYALFMSSYVRALNDYQDEHLDERQPLPDGYVGLHASEMDRRILAARDALGDRLLILGHHYQRDEVIRFADATGDSLKLSRFAATRSNAEFIVFCGVHFMAESADLLCAPAQQVILPDLAAGCSMADMAALDQVERCWDELGAAGIRPVPITYINSAADIKAFCGERGGITCTSANASKVFEWGWQRGEAILSLPDEHLGRNTAYCMGVPLDRMAVWDPDQMNGGVSPDDLRRARIILWKGHCSVHTRFSVAQIATVRAEHPSVKVIVHPECTWEVVQASDETGSTEFIIDRVSSSPPGSVWAVGTEIHLVSRLARAQHPLRTVLTLDRFGCLCSTMFRVSPNHLLWVLEGLVAGQVRNRIQVPEARKPAARLALERMLALP
jgi:quinolinate synthase